MSELSGKLAVIKISGSSVVFSDEATTANAGRTE